MLRRIVEGSARKPVLGRTLVHSRACSRWGVYADRQHPARRDPRSLRRPGHRLHRVCRARPPQVVEDQVTYPLSTAMLAVPFAKVVRGYSFFGFSFVYIIFEDGTDLYWARSRVLESLNFVSARLPVGRHSLTLGPDATGVGWVYEYALVDRSGKHDLAELRSIQDWHLRYELQTVPGVAEVASVGGTFASIRSRSIPISSPLTACRSTHVRHAIERSNNDIGGRARRAGRDRVHGARVAATSDPCATSSWHCRRRRCESGTPILLRSVATVSPRAPSSAAADRPGRRRRERSGRRRHHALRRECARDDPEREGEARRARRDLAPAKGSKSSRSTTARR